MLKVINTKFAGFISSHTFYARSSDLFKMVKWYNVLVKIHNSSGLAMTYQSKWYNNGREANGFPWPDKICDGSEVSVLNYESDWSLVGCSGYVTYQMGGTMITIAFSNPVAGYNKLGVGTNGQGVWENMGSPYESITERITLANNTVLAFTLHCTGSDVNTADVFINKAS